MWSITSKPGTCRNIILRRFHFIAYNDGTLLTMLAGWITLIFWIIQVIIMTICLFSAKYMAFSLSGLLSVWWIKDIGWFSLFIISDEYYTHVASYKCPVLMWWVTYVYYKSDLLNIQSSGFILLYPILHNINR